MKRILVLVALLATLAAASPALFAARAGGRQGRLGPPPPAAPGASEEANVTPAEIRRMFDSYALMQAQDQLKITDDQFPKFLTRFKALQDLRRRTLQERNHLLQDLRKLGNDPQPDEAQIKDRLKLLQDLEEHAQADMRKGYEAIDQILDVRQQARFRVFEEQMEQRMLQLITRARQANRPRP
jgi:Spy/CpxP family protein refolding chaperone